MPITFHHDAYAFDILVKSVTSDGKPSYFINAGNYKDKAKAETFRSDLAQTIHASIKITHPDNNLFYSVVIGPIADFTQAKAIQQTLNTKNVVSTSEKIQPEATLPKPKGRLWNLRNADIRAVIAEVSRATGKNFIIDPRVQGKISIVASTPMTDKELYPVFLSILQVSGYAAIENGNTTKIVPNIDAKTQSSDLLSQLRHPANGDEILVEVIPVHYVPAEQLVPVLRPLMPQWSNIAAYGPSNMLILSGRANNIRSLAHIIKQVDSSNVNGIDIVPLKHALAMDIATTLKDILKAQPGGLGSRSQPLIAADDRSNSLLISGNKTDRLRLRLLIIKLDKGDQTGANSNTKVVYLNYLRAEDLVPILAGIAQANFSGNVGTTIGTITRPPLDSTNPASNLTNNASSGWQSGSSSSSSTTTTPSNNSSVSTTNTTTATTQNEGTTKPTAQIIAEPNTNSIIISAPSSLIKTLQAVISQLDIMPAQLLIEALVAEVNESDANNLGIEWGTDQQTGDPQKFRPGFAIINSKTNKSDFQAQIYALARQQKANILSTPSVVVLDNRQAKILVGKQVSVASTTYPNNGGGTTTASPYVTFDRVNVALHLYVRPQITRGKGIQLQIDQGNDTLDPASTTDSSTNPTFKISSIVTSVQVESGDIVVLGGLAQDSLGNDDNRLPILGDIPGIGKLFQHNLHAREKRVLMVFIKPLIIGNQHESIRITGGKYDNIRQYQLDWLRSQEYNEKSEASILPPIKEEALPAPFGAHVTAIPLKKKAS